MTSKFLYALNGGLLSLWIGLLMYNAHLATQIQQRDQRIRVHHDQLERLKHCSAVALSPGLTAHQLKKRIRQTAQHQDLKIKSLVLTPQSLPSLMQIKLATKAFLEDDAFRLLDRLRTLPGFLGFQEFRLEKHSESLPPFTFQVTTLWSTISEEAS